jgi:hypothetical protein
LPHAAAVADQWIERTLLSDIHFSAQFLFQIGQQASRKPRRCTWAGVDQQIEVAVRARIAPRKGAEHTYTLDAVFGRDGENRGSLILA